MKDEIRKIIHGDDATGESNNGEGTLIQTIARKLQTGKTAGSATERAEYNKTKENKIIESFAQEHNLWVENIDENKYLSEGAEQKIYFNGDTVLKVNDGIYYKSWEDYFIALQIHNLLFPDTSYTLKGFCQKDNRLFAVVEQPFIKANGAYDFDELKTFLENDGFTHKKNQDFYHEKWGIILEDLHDENVIKKDGVYFFIDTVIYIMNAK
jgi:hypothetical protein